jgi:3'-phosphoadenosine 5'-phosphosulfate (PAPS) 3'-phosphatase
VGIADISDFKRIGLVARVWDIGAVRGVCQAIGVHHLVPFGQSMSYNCGPDKTASASYQ